MPRKKLTRDEYIARARFRHGDYYDYSKLDYQGMDKKVIIICPEHGEYEVNAISHLTQICALCENDEVNKEFIEFSKEKWGDNRWGYDKLDYIRAIKPIELYCNLHNVYFAQIAQNHLNGANGCPECKKVLYTVNLMKAVIRRLKRHPQSEIIKEACSLFEEITDRVNKSLYKWEE